MPMNPRLLRPTSSTLDKDAAIYLNAVAVADGQQLEPAVRKAVNDFVVGCKQDGIWSAIKASCILAGARTLAGALVPLKGAAPTNNNFVSGDYDRETGLVGNGSTKYLDSNRANNADPQDDSHNAVWVHTAEVSPNFGIYIGSANVAGTNHLGRASVPSTDLIFRNRSTTAVFAANDGGATGFIGMSRAAAASYVTRHLQTNNTQTNASSAPSADSVHIFQRSAGSGVTTARLAFYSIGESLDLAALDDRVSALITAIGAAI